MMKKTAWVFLLALVCAVLFSSVKAFGQLSQMTYSAGVKSFKNYVKNPDCAKNVLNITASGGSFAKGTTTPLNLDTGSECTIDASSSGQTYTWALSTLGQDLKGKNCEARFVFEGDASLYKAYVKNGSSQVTTDLQLTYPTYSRDVSINVPCGDLSASNTVVIESTSASAAAISVAQVYFGEATNLSNVAQAKMIGSLKYAGAASCAWSTTSSTWANFSADTDCATPTVTGIAAAPGTKIPAIVLNNAPPGEYHVVAQAPLYRNSSSTTSCRFRLTDGTTPGNSVFSYTDSAEGVLTGGTATAHFTYTNAQSTVTFNLQGNSSNNTNTCAVDNSSTTAPDSVTFFVYYFPSSSEIAVRQSAQLLPTVQKFTSGSGTYTLPAGTVSIRVKAIGGGGGGSGGGTGSLGSGGNGTASTFVTASGGTLISAGGGTGGLGSGAGGTGGSSSITSPAIGSAISGAYGQGYNTTSAGATGGAAGGNSVFGGAGSGAANLAGLAASANTGSGGAGGGGTTNGGPGGASGGYVDAIINNPNSSYSYTVGTGGTAGAAGTSGSAGGAGAAGYIEITEYYSSSTPLLVGSVTSNTSGMERVERARLAAPSGGACAITSQSGAWISGTPVSSGTGRCKITFANAFTSGPTCVCNSGTPNTCKLYDVATTYFEYIVENVAGAAANDLGMVVCMGSK